MTTDSLEGNKGPLSYEEYAEAYEVDEESNEAIKYFFRERSRYRLGVHKKARPETWAQLVSTFCSCFNDDFNQGHDLDMEAMETMIDKYFTTSFWKGCDYSIFHFNSEGVKLRRFYEEAY